MQQINISFVLFTSVDIRALDGVMTLFQIDVASCTKQNLALNTF